MPDEPRLLLARDGPVARIILNRPAIHNAFDEHLIAQLTEALAQLGADPAIRAVVLTGAGKSFSAGADLDWMRRMADYDEAQNLADARNLERLLRTLDELPKPTLAMVNGAALGGGTGLVAACDIAIAADTATFGTTEVRLGLIPAVISPYVIRAIGSRQARRYFLTGERISAAEAQRIGLVHEVVAPSELKAKIGYLLDTILAGAPQAVAKSKKLVRLVETLDGSLIGEATAKAIADRRATDEAKEGVQAFLEKRKAGWNVVSTKSQ
jgi:methylglutaconyl-CoA hydratase